MSVYQEILDWSQNKPAFIKDALRRLITSTELSDSDINELVQLVKKECGDTSITLDSIPLDSTHLPNVITPSGSYPRINSLGKPRNICSLHDQGELEFSNTGLNVIYGKNGSGKSSYSRILRKLCWSRNPSVTLKKNVFSPSTTQQQVDFSLVENNSDTNFSWTEGSVANPILKSIFVFDNSCGDIYLNNENPTEYKPVGIDLLEKLISTFSRINQVLSSSITSYNQQKPEFPQDLNQTDTANWFQNIEKLERTVLDTQIRFEESDLERKQELINLTAAQNPQQNITNLTNQRTRINNIIQQILQIERLFNTESINELRENKAILDSVNEAYQIATRQLESINTLDGFGTSPWRALWQAAQNYAHSANLSDGENFPSGISLDKCVLCQQDLDVPTKLRLTKFNEFVLNDVSTQLNSINSIIREKIEKYEALELPRIETLLELEELIPNFRDIFAQFSARIESLKRTTITYLRNGEELNVNLETLSPSMLNIIPKLNAEIDQNNELLQNRNALVLELNELKAKEFLFNRKASILRYFDEFKYKSWISRCQSQLPTTGISKKIGELIEIQAVSLQHQEFISHLSYFNPALANKVQISKTRTSQGNTFQKCGLNGVNEPINTILSEGEQKVIALSNFLAECTIDNRLNTIVFDDPVTSLDMDYRDLIATKIVELSRDRQIIVFTHDLSFLRLLIDTHKSIITTECTVIGIDKYNDVSGVVTDEIPYLAKNVQERVDSIRRILTEHDALPLNDAHGRETKLDSARKRFRMLLERSVEEILSNKTYERFNKNIHFKKGNLSSYIVTEQADVDFLLELYGKYSVSEHDGGTSTIPQLPNKTQILQDIGDYSTWKETFRAKLRAFQATYN